MSDFPLSVSRTNDIVIGLSLDLNENVIEVNELNESALGALGYERDEIVGTNFMDIVPDNVSEYIFEELDFSPTGRDLSYILRRISHFSLINRQGKTTEYAVKVFPVTSSSPNALMYEVLLRDKKRKHLQDSINSCCIGNLTDGIPNRQAGDEILQSIVEFLRENTIDIVVGIMSIDNFSELKEEYGSESISEVNQKIGKLFDDCCRTEDTIVCLDEGLYIVLLVDCSPSNANIVFNRLRMFIEKAAFMLDGEDHNGTVSISFSYLTKEIAGLNLMKKMEIKHTDYGNQVSQIDLAS